MKRLANVVLAQGVSAKQNPTNHFLSFPLLKIALFIACIAISPALPAQYNQVDVNTLDFQTTVPEGLYQSGDVVKVDIHIGSSGSPVKDLLGFNLWLDLGSVARPASNYPSMDFEGSCLVTSSAFDSTTAFSPVSGLYSFQTLLGVGNAGTGTGKVVSLWLEITANNVDAASIIANAGGLALIENISGKQAAPSVSLADAATAFPNPATHTLYIDPVSKSSTAKLYTLDGRLLTTVALSTTVRTWLNVDNMPRGMSLLVFEDGSRRRIVLN